MSTETAKLQTSSDEPIPCPVDHQCEGEQSCDCWCELHDVPIAECPTFRLVDSWTSQLQAEQDDVKTHKARLLEALGMNPLRDWDDIVNAVRCIRAERDALKAELAEARAAIEQILNAAADKLDVLPPGGALLSGPYWYRQGVRDAASLLRDWANHPAALDAPQRPEDTREETGIGCPLCRNSSRSKVPGYECSECRTVYPALGQPWLRSVPETTPDAPTGGED